MTEYKKFFETYGIRGQIIKYGHETREEAEHLANSIKKRGEIFIKITENDGNSIMPKYHVWEKVYPEITADKILKLEEVIIKEFGDIAYSKGYITDINGLILDSFINCKCGAEHNSYDGRLVLEQFRHYGQGKTRLEALLNLLVKLSDQLDKEEVRRIVEE